MSKFTEDFRLSMQRNFIMRAHAFHNNFYDYSKVDYQGMTTKVVIICPLHGEFSQEPDSHLKYNCPECGKIKRWENRKRPYYKEGEKTLYGRWVDIKRRCLNKEFCKYKNYGGRGIGIHPDFMDFRKFYDYISSLPHFENFKENKLTLDRIDNDGDYAPGNLRWATPELQGINMRSRAGVTGEENITLKRGKAFQVTLIRCSKRYRLGTFSTLEEAVKARDEFKAQVDPIILQNQKI